ncbi:MAG: hypothetical protein KF878_35945 [Planctomycetes bacterium]|nr:hypothetical protein [Planctomycetota bacterium]
MGNEQERVWFAREVMQQFVKCFTNLKLYPHHHTHVKTSLDAWSSRIRSYLALHDILRIGVTQDALLVEETPIYEEQNRNENLAFRLYVDGLREISITRGLTVQEAERLAFVFYQAVVDPRVDSTGLLWEGDFKNIDYVAINSLSEAWEQPDYMSQDALKLLKDMNRDVDAIVASLTAPGARNTYTFEVTDGAAEFEKAKELDAGEGEREEGDDIFEVSEQSLLELQRDVQSWGPDRVLRVLIDGGLDGLAVASDIVGRDHVRWLLRESVDTALRSKDMELLGAILGRLEGELELVEDEDEEMIRGVFAYMGEEQNVGRLTELAQGQAIGGPKAYCRILGLIGDSGLTAAVATFMLTKNKEMQEALSAFISDNLHRNPKVLAPMLDPQVPPEVVRAALFIAAKRLKGKELEEALDRARQHSDPKIKEYATHQWRTQTDEGRLQTFTQALETSESKQDRMRAVSHVTNASYKPALEVLKRVVDSQAFLGRDADEKLAYIDAVRRLGGKTAIAFLQQQASRSTLVFNRKAMAEIRDAAQKALDAIKQGR